MSTILRFDDNIKLDGALFQVFGRIDSHDALARMKTMHRRPGTITEFLAYKIMYPHIQIPRIVVILGTLIQQSIDRSVFVAFADGDAHEISISDFERDWVDDCGFFTMPGDTQSYLGPIARPLDLSDS